MFDQGRLVEQGRHDALMARQGIYWQMFTASPDWHNAADAVAPTYQLREGA